MTALTIQDVRRNLAKKYKERGEELFPPLDKAREGFPFISSPSAIINALCGIGGVPRGRITEIYGPESTGKTTLVIEMMVQAQMDPNAFVLFVDYEHALDIGYAIDLGLNTDPKRFLWVQPDYFEQGAEVMRQFIEAGLVDLVAIDSVAAMMPLSSFEGDLDPNAGKTGAEAKSKMGRVGLHAALLSQTCNWLTKRISTGRIPAVVAINQTRTKINTRTGVARQDATGGNALKYYSTIRLELGRAIGEGTGSDGHEEMEQEHDRIRVTVFCVKNKVAPPFRKGTMVIRFGTGIDNIESIADLATMYLDLKHGSWWKYTGESPETSFSVQGRDSFVEHLKTSPETLKELEAKSLSRLQAKRQQTLTPKPQQTQQRKRNVIEAPVAPVDAASADDSLVVSA